MRHFDFINPPRSARPVAFWFLNHWLSDAAMIRQIDEMAERGMGGIMLHPRDGLHTEYLSDTFAKRLETAVKRAEERGMSVWLYDENHYPSGPAGFKLEIDDRSMQTLLCIAEEKIPAGGQVSFPEADFHVLVNPDTGVAFAQDMVPDSWNNGAKAFAFRVQPWESYPGSHFFNYPDYTDPELTDAFLAITHEWYREKLGQYFGTTIRGIFSDNSCGNFGIHRRATPWGNEFPQRFKAATGKNLLEILPRLFDASLPGTEEARQLFWNFFDKVYLDNYFGRITSWCERNGIFSTGHLACEDGLFEHVRQCGDYFDVMRHFSYCAVDDLGPGVAGSDLVDRTGDAGWLPAKLTASSARFLGRPEVMCECFGLASEPWNLTLREMRRISGWLAVAGINVFVPHGLYYSIAGHRKWECPPDHIHTPSWKYYAHWTDWIARYSLAATGGVNLAETMLLYPGTAMRSLIELGDPAGNGLLHDYGAKAEELEKNFRLTVNALFANHIDFEIADEILLEKAKLTPEGKICIPASDSAFDMQVSAVILAGTAQVSKKAGEILKCFAKAGGKVFLAGSSETLDFPVHFVNPETNWQDILSCQVKISDPFLCSRSWINKEEFFCLVHNRSDVFRKAEIHFPGRDSLFLLDPEDGSCMSWKGTSLSMAPAQMFLFTSFSAKVLQSFSRLPERKIALPESWTFSTDKPNVLPLRDWKSSFSGAFQRETFHFECESVPEDLRLILDIERSKAELASGTFGNRLKCFVNGMQVSAFVDGTYLDLFMPEAPIAHYVKLGANSIEIVREALLCEWEYRTNPPMLIGTFELSEKNRIVPFTGLAHAIPVHPGFPYFAGESIFCAELELPSEGGKIEVENADSCVVIAEADGNLIGVRVAPPYAFDLTPMAGKKIMLSLRFANTNAALFS